MLLAVTLSLLVYAVFVTWTSARRAQMVVEGAGADTDVSAEAELPDEPAPPPVAAVAPAPIEATPARDVPVEGCDVRASLSTNGGVVHSLVLETWQAPYTVQPLWRWAQELVVGDGGPWRPYGDEPPPVVLGTERSRLLGAGAGDFASPLARVEVLEETPSRVQLRGVSPEGLEITRALKARTTESGGCAFDYDVSWRNTGASTWSGDLWVLAHDEMVEGGGRYANVLRPYIEVGGSVEYWMNSAKITGERVEGAVDWFGLADNYFAALLVPDAGNTGSLVVGEYATADGVTTKGPRYVVRATLGAGERHSEHMLFYVGPKTTESLGAAHPALESAIQLGWFGFFGRILLWMLKLFHSVVGNWGVAIIVLTLVVKGAFFPLTQTSFKSSQAMAAIQPKLQEIREQFKDSPEELNKRTIELFREAGVNPLGGCLPMFIQMPIWIALYNVLLYSVELYHTEFFYLRDLSAMDPIGVVPLTVVVLFVVQQQFMPTGNMDPVQARVLKFMPIFFGILFFTFPSGLVVYIFVNTLLSILQQWYIKRTYRAPTPAPAT